MTQATKDVLNKLDKDAIIKWLLDIQIDRDELRRHCHFLEQEIIKANQKLVVLSGLPLGS